MPRLMMNDTDGRRGWSTAHVTLHVWRPVGHQRQGLFTFAGELDTLVLLLVMQQVRRLTRAVPARWRVEILAIGLDGPLLHEVRAALHVLRCDGLQARLATAPHRVAAQWPAGSDTAGPSSWAH